MLTQPGQKVRYESTLEKLQSQIGSMNTLLFSLPAGLGVILLTENTRNKPNKINFNKPKAYGTFYS